MTSIFRNRPLLGAVVLAVATVLTWYAWLGHDTEMQVDPATGVASGPYTVPQVAGCVVTLVVLLVLAVLTGVPRWFAAAAIRKKAPKSNLFAKTKTPTPWAGASAR